MRPRSSRAAARRPPPLIRLSARSASSAPSMVRSSGARLSSSASGMASARAFCAVRSEVAVAHDLHPAAHAGRENFEKHFRRGARAEPEFHAVFDEFQRPHGGGALEGGGIGGRVCHGANVAEIDRVHPPDTGLLTPPSRSWRGCAAGRRRCLWLPPCDRRGVAPAAHRSGAPGADRPPALRWSPRRGRPLP